MGLVWKSLVPFVVYHLSEQVVGTFETDGFRSSVVHFAAVCLVIEAVIQLTIGDKDG